MVTDLRRQPPLFPYYGAVDGVGEARHYTFSNAGSEVQNRSQGDTANGRILMTSGGKSRNSASAKTGCQKRSALMHIDRWMAGTHHHWLAAGVTVPIWPPRSATQAGRPPPPRGITHTHRISACRRRDLAPCLPSPLCRRDEGLEILPLLTLWKHCTAAARGTSLGGPTKGPRMRRCKFATLSRTFLEMQLAMPPYIGPF